MLRSEYAQMDALKALLVVCLRSLNLGHHLFEINAIGWMDGRMQLLGVGRVGGRGGRGRNDPGVKQEAVCPPANFWKY